MRYMDGAIFNDLEWLSEASCGLSATAELLVAKHLSYIGHAHELFSVVVDVFKIICCSEPTDSFMVNVTACSSTAPAAPPPGAATAASLVLYQFISAFTCQIIHVLWSPLSSVDDSFIPCPWFWIFIYRNGHVKILWLTDWLILSFTLGVKPTYSTNPSHLNRLRIMVLEWTGLMMLIDLFLVCFSFISCLFRVVCWIRVSFLPHVIHSVIWSYRTVPTFKVISAILSENKRSPLSNLW